MPFQQDSWMKSYEACEALAREVMEKISYRNQQPKNSVASSKASAEARKLIKNFNDNLNSLKTSHLSSKMFHTEREFERRQRLIDGLSNKKVQIDEAYNERVAGSSRQALLGNEFGTRSANFWEVEEDENTRDLNIDEIREKQQMVIREQDEGLDSLHDIVVRQKMMAQNIGEELDFHNELIDDIIDHTGNTRERLVKETRHITIVDRKSGSCCYWVIIVLLLIAIITLFAVPS